MDQLEQFLRALQWPVAGGILGTGFVIVYKSWRFFTGDFLSPWRTDTAHAREDAAAARAEAASARAAAAEALSRAWKAEAREAHLLVILERHGIDVSSIPPDHDEDLRP